MYSITVTAKVAKSEEGPKPPECSFDVSSCNGYIDDCVSTLETFKSPLSDDHLYGESKIKGHAPVLGYSPCGLWCFFVYLIFDESKEMKLFLKERLVLDGLAERLVTKSDDLSLSLRNPKSQRRELILASCSLMTSISMKNICTHV